MPPQDEKSQAALFLNAHPQLRDAMAASSAFPELKKRKALDDEGEEEQLYIVRGDTLGDEEELYLDALFRGSNPEGSDELSRRLFLELDESSRSLILESRERP